MPTRDETVLPFVFGMLPTLPLQHPELRATAFRIVDRFRRWLLAHRDYVPPMFEFVVAHGLLPSPDAPPTAIPLPAPYQETACNAVNSLGCECPLQLQANLLALPSRLNMLALHQQSATRVTEAIMTSIFTLDAGHHDAPLTALMGPMMALLQRVAADPRAACDAAAADGSLLAVALFKDGLVKRFHAQLLHTSESALEALAAEAHARAGQVTYNPEVIPPFWAAGALVGAQLLRLGEMCYAVSRAGEVYMGEHSQFDPPDARDHAPGGHPTVAEMRQRRLAAAADAAAASVRAAMLRLLEAMWPTVAAVALQLKGALLSMKRYGRLGRFCGGVPCAEPDAGCL